MSRSGLAQPKPASLPPAGSVPFSEAPAWTAVRPGWRRLHGDFHELGYSIEWHDFHLAAELDWSRSFHPESLEICLNLDGSGRVSAGSAFLDLPPSSAGFYTRHRGRLDGIRSAGEHHRFITIELSRRFLGAHFSRSEPCLHPVLKNFLGGRGAAPEVSAPLRLSTEQRAMAMSLRQPPVLTVAQRLWSRAKALEVASTLFYQAPSGEEMFCQHQKRLNRERADKVLAILKSQLAEPPSLEEIGRAVGCSPFHLSRIFTQEMGRSMTTCLRELRMERAAVLLREGKLNVTAVALEVGYSSPSHFSSAFHQTYGCCPGLYPMQTTSQRASSASRPEPDTAS